MVHEPNGKIFTAVEVQFNQINICATGSRVVLLIHSTSVQPIIQCISEPQAVCMQSAKFHSEMSSICQ